MVSITVRSRKHSFDLKFVGKFNFIVGDSGSLKSYFISLCSKRVLGVNYVTGSFVIDGMRLKSDKIRVYTNGVIVEEDNYRNALLSLHNSLFIIDEFCNIFRMKDIASLLSESDNYFVFVTRKLPGFLPINVESIYQLKLDNKTKTIINEQVFTKFNTQNFGKIDYILTEDSTSGRSFFKYNFPSVEICDNTGVIDGKILSRDNSQLHNFLYEDLQFKDNILVVYDSAAYGSFIKSLQSVLEIAKSIGKNVRVLDWEAFEIYVLSLPMFNEHFTNEDTKCYYNSLEQLGEIHLKNLINYSKQTQLLACLRKDLACNKCKFYSNCRFEKFRKQNEILIAPLDTINKADLDSMDCF